MKKIAFTFLMTSLVAASSMADGGPGVRARQSCQTGAYSQGGYHNRCGEPLHLGEFVCALFGGTAGALITNAATGSTPATFIGALIGGAIGVNACKWFGNEKNLGAQAAAFQAGLDGASCGERDWRSGQYHGRLTIIAESYDVTANGDSSGDNTCKFFETTIHENETRKYIGKTSAWACKASGQWIVTREQRISKRDTKTCGNRSLPEDGRGSVVIGDGRSQRTVRDDRSRIRGDWNFALQNLSRRVMDYGVSRGMRLAARTPLDPTYAVLGNFVALSDDGQSVVMFTSEVRRPIFPVDQIALECRGTEVCLEEDVRTSGDVSGIIHYIFNNGDVVINDMRRGWRIQPGAWVN